MNTSPISRRRVLSLSATALVPQFITKNAGAQGDDYPSHPITMIVPFPPGGVADAVGRPVAEALGRILKQVVVVENRSGAGGGVSVIKQIAGSIFTINEGR